MIIEIFWSTFDDEPTSDDICFMFFVANFDALAQASDFQIKSRKADKLSSSADCSFQTLDVWDTRLPADWMPTHKLVYISHSFVPSYMKVQ